MALFRERERKIFPLGNIDAVLRLFRTQLEKREEPNLSLLSIVIGAIENSLTCNRSSVAQVKTTAASKGTDSATSDASSSVFPPLQLTTVEALYQKFVAQIKGSVDLSQFGTSAGYATRDVVKRVSDVVWSALTRSCYKDRAHLQSLYSYLTGNKLDCFGVAFAVVAACQVLGFRDVHLTLSEDHAWVVFGKDGEDTAEVTWHGKGHEDKRGLPITVGVAEKSWLYLNGHPVKCTRHMEVAALVSGVNPSISATTDSVELGALQQQLLWMLHDMGHLARYPMALGNLGDLEEISPTSGRPHCTALFREAIIATRKYYNNHHVYPYTYLGGYMYRNKRYKEAIESWANAADVIRTYNYNREDEEIYKEFLDIANDLIPNVMKAVVCTVVRSSSVPAAEEAAGHRSITDDPECFSHLLRFYDGICEWEEGSSTPVLHIGWAQSMVNTISKFDAGIRAKVEISVEKDAGRPGIVAIEQQQPSQHVCNSNDDPKRVNHETNNNVVDGTTPLKNRKTEPFVALPAAADGTNGSVGHRKDKRRHGGKGDRVRKGHHHHHHRGHHRCLTSDFIRSLETQINPNEAPHPNIAALAAACAENILNPEYLLGSGEPFSSRSSSSSTSSNLTDVRLDCCDLLSSQSNGTPFRGLTMDSMLKAESPAEGQMPRHGTAPPEATACGGEPLPRVQLNSEKMKGLKELLLAEKLNVSAIQLQLTAQSQVHVARRAKVAIGDSDYVRINYVGTSRSTKRSRRD